MKMLKFLIPTFVLIMMLAFALSCEKKDRDVSIDEPRVEAIIFCDTVRSVRYGDTLKVVKRTVTDVVFKGQRYWQAMLYSDQKLPPTKFANTPTTHRVVINDTVAISDNSLFFITRIR